ncbi:hypothetical protein BKA81DRAFT_76762 [Phyllosticta paracitricarpa]
MPHSNPPTASLPPAHPDILTTNQTCLSQLSSSINSRLRGLQMHSLPPAAHQGFKPGVRVGPWWWQRSYTHQTNEELASRETLATAFGYPPPWRRPPAENHKSSRRQTVSSDVRSQKTRIGSPAVGIDIRLRRTRKTCSSRSCCFSAPQT